MRARQPPAQSANDLIADWQRYDWRETLFAPGLCVLQALTRDGRTASGAGESRDLALARCLGETAEIAALRAGRAPGFCAARDGIAAHPDPATAAVSALYEACERRAIWQWWRGEAPTAPVHPAWIKAEGLTGHLADLRAGAAVIRQTGWWQVQQDDGPCVMICLSSSAQGQEPILGYGCHADPVQAAAAAMREMLLMEVNLMEAMAARFLGEGAGDPAIAATDLARRLSTLLPSAEGVWPKSAPIPVWNPAQPEAPAHWLAEPCRWLAITPPDGPVLVWLCQPAGPMPSADPVAGSPFQ